MSIYRIDGDKKLFVDANFDIQKIDPSLNGMNAYSLDNEYKLQRNDFNRIFFSPYGIDYISGYFLSRGLKFQVVTHPYDTNTCFEKAKLLNNLNPLNVIKTLYFEYSLDNSLYAIVVPETGCLINKSRLKELLDFSESETLKKSKILPRNMKFGTCSPFITENDLKINGGNIKKIIFDCETLEVKKNEKNLDDFSFGINHRMSLQMNYYDCFNMLKFLYGDVVEQHEILNFSFKRNFSRKGGRICLSYEFNNINYRTASFINSMHGYGDISCINDHADELNLHNLYVGAYNHSALTK